MSINERIFSSLFNDAYLSGSFELEGMAFSDSINYLKSVFASFPEEEVGHLGDLLNAFEKLSEYETIAKGLRGDGAFQSFASRIFEDISNIPKEGFLLLPGGYFSTESGHGMLYEFKRDSEDNILFIVHNSGDGLQFHAKQGGLNKNRSDPQYAYKIPKEALNDRKGFEEILKEIFSQRDSGAREETDASYLYKTIFPKWHYLGGELVPTNTPKEFFTAGQLSGTCAMRVLHQMLKMHFESKEDYSAFIFRCRVHALEEYMSSLDEQGLLGDARYHHQVQEAIRKQYRMLHRLSIQKRLSPEVQKKEIERLQRYESMLIKTPMPLVTTPDGSIPLRTTLPLTLTTGSPPPTREALTPFRAPPKDLIALEVSDNIFSSLDKILERLEELRKMKDSQTMRVQIEEFLLNLPLPENSLQPPLLPFYQVIDSPEKAQLFYEKMIRLQQYYFLEAGARSGLPTTCVAKMSVFAVCGHIDEAFRTSAGHLPRLLISRSMEGVYASTQDFELDNRISHIKKLALGSIPRYQEVEFYSGIISGFPEIKIKLEASYYARYGKTVGRDIDYPALFYLIQNWGDLEKIEAYRPLMDKFRLLLSMEQACFYGLDSRVAPYHSPRRLQVNSKPGYKVELTDEVRDIKLKVLESHNRDCKCTPITWFQGAFNFFDSYGQRRFLDRENNYLLEHSSLEQREMRYLRFNASVQLPLTLDYFLKHLDKLNKPELQVYLETNLMEPPLLSMALENSETREDLLNQFDLLITKGLAYHCENGTLNKEGLYFIRLAYLVNHYGYQKNPAVFQERLNRIKVLCNHWLSHAESTCLPGLHYYRFLAAGEDNATRLESYFYLQIHKNDTVPEDLQSQNEWERQCLHWQNALNAHPECMTDEVIFNIVSSLDSELDLKSCKVTIAFPRVEIEDRKRHYTLDCLSGRIYQGGMAMIAMPSITNPMRQSHLFNYLNLGTLKHCYVSQDHNTYQFLKDGKTYRYRLGVGWQAQFEDATGRTAWYECPLENYKAFLQNSKIADCNAIFSHSEHAVWVCCEHPEILITDKQGLPWFRTEAQEGQFTLREVKTGEALVDSRSAVHEIFKSIEDPSFVLVTTGDEIEHIHLLRFGLSFERDKTTKALLFTHKDKQYHYIENAPIVGEGVHAMLWRNNEIDFCLLPIQPFKPTGRRGAASEYHQMVQERSLAEKLNNSERFLFLKMKDGIPIPENPSDALYLCYVFLGSNQVDKAMDMLDTCTKRFGTLLQTEEELLFLDWILHRLGEKKSSNQNPSYTACKLKACALFSTLPKDAEKEIIPLLDRLSKCENKLPREHHLSLQEQKRLYNHVQKGFPTESKETASNALGSAWLKAHLQTLLKEKRTLEAITSRRPLTESELRRRDEINTFLATHPGVLISHTTIEKVMVPLEIDERTVLSRSCWPYIETSIAKRNQLIAELSINFPGHMSNNFIGFLNIAISDDETHRQKLEQFCKATLITAKYQPDALKDKELVFYCNVLYRILSSNAKPTFSQEVKKDELITLAHSLDTTCQPILVPELIDKETSNSLSELIAAMPVQNVVPSPPSVLGDPAEPPLVWTDLNFESWTHWSDLFQNPEGGVKKYEAHLARFQSAKTMLAPVDAREKISGQLLARRTSLEAAQQQGLEEILSLANLGPDIEEAHLLWQMQLGSGHRSVLSINRLLKLYLHNDIERYRLETGLSSEKINQLHTMLTRYVSQGVRLKQCHAIEAELAKLTSMEEGLEKDEQYFKTAELLFTPDVVDPKTETFMSLFQFYEGKILRPQQKAALARLLASDSRENFSELVERIIPGGGKSKVLLPLLVAQKTTGSNLVIVEGPRALLKTNLPDWNAITSPNFQQEGILFEFDRDTDISVRHLQILHQQLVEAMVNEQYLVMSGDVTQSIELKYLELLHNPKDTVEWEQQLEWMEKILDLFNNRGDVIIDEVHEGLCLKYKLNYTLGNEEAVPATILSNCAELFKFFKEVALDGIEGLAGCSLLDLLQNPDLGQTEAQYQAATRMLAHALVHQDNSPLHHIFETFPDKQRDLESYLLEESAEIPEFILLAPPHIKNQLALYKEQINGILPYTLQRKCHANYGPSHDSTKTEEERAVAIPYYSSNNPNERSRFGNELETINYTIQSFLINGVPKALFYHFIKELVILSRKELLAKGKQFDDLKNTEAALRFRAIYGHKGLELMDIDLNNSRQMDMLYEDLHRHDLVVFDVLRNQVLPKIKRDPNILHSNAINLVEQFHTAQGWSGTLANASTFHPRLKYDALPEIGTDSYILAGLQAKSPTFRAIESRLPKDLIPELLHHYAAKDKVRTIIDIAAKFKGVSNLNVASQIADYLHHQPAHFNEPVPLQYVIFFNENNELSALPVRSSEGKREPILLGTSDVGVIAERLKCSYDACFTYYDESHTTGTDLKQHSGAKGVVLIDQNTLHSHFLQGVMRMRDLIQGNQTIDVMVPKGLEKKSLEEWVASMEAREASLIQSENFQSACLCLYNLVRKNLLSHIKSISGVGAGVRKAALFAKWEDYFIEKQGADIFEKYGRMNKNVSTSDYLKQLKENLLKDWHKELSGAGMPVIAEEARLMQQKMEEVVSRASAPNVCPPTCKERQKPLGQSVTIEAQALNTRQNQAELLQQQMTLRQQASLTSCVQNQWASLDCPGVTFKSLNDICERSFFSKHIQASSNYYNCHYNQDISVGPYLKPVHTLLFQKKGDALICTLLSQEESKHVMALVAKEPPGHCWISTTQHRVLAGTPMPAFTEDKAYQNILEQVRYFNGEFSLLMGEDSSLQWMTEDTEAKIDYFNEHLGESREYHVEHQILLKDVIQLKTEIFQYLTQFPERAQSDSGWETIFPKMSPIERIEYQTVAKILLHLQRTWYSETPDIRHLVALSLKSSSYIESYTNKLEMIKHVIKRLATMKPPLPRLIELPEVQALLKSQAVPIISKLAAFFPEVSNALYTPIENQFILTELLKQVPNQPSGVKTLLQSLGATSPGNELDWSQVRFPLLSSLDVFQLLLSRYGEIPQAVFTHFFEAALDFRTLDLLLNHPLMTSDLTLLFISKLKDPELQRRASLHYLKNFPSYTHDNLMRLLGSIHELSPDAEAFLLQKMQFGALNGILDSRLFSELTKKLSTATLDEMISVGIEKKILDLRWIFESPITLTAKNCYLVETNRSVRYSFLYSKARDINATAWLLYSDTEAGEKIEAEKLLRCIACTPITPTFIAWIKQYIDVCGRPKFVTDFLISRLDSLEAIEAMNKVFHPTENMATHIVLLEKRYQDLCRQLEQIALGSTKFNAIAEARRQLVDTLLSEGRKFFELSHSEQLSAMVSFETKVLAEIDKAKKIFSVHPDKWGRFINKIPEQYNKLLEVEAAIKPLLRELSGFHGFKSRFEALFKDALAGAPAPARGPRRS